MFEILKAMVGESKKYQAIGTQIAEDCFVEGLEKGEIVKHSEIMKMISQNYSFNTKAVEYGFHKRMLIYVKKGDIESFNFGEGETIFVHKNYTDNFIKEINENLNSSP